jgi:hypothetical protein
MNWYALVGVVVTILIQLTSVIAAYYGLKAEIAATAAKVDLITTAERAERKLEVTILKTSVTELLAAAEQTLKDITRRVGVLEAGQDEWTKTLRDRTHELSNVVNGLVLKVDRLERPTLPPPH